MEHLGAIWKINKNALMKKANILKGQSAKALNSDKYNKHTNIALLEKDDTIKSAWVFSNF